MPRNILAKLSNDDVFSGLDVVFEQLYSIFSVSLFSGYFSPGNYDLIDKFLGGSTARKCVFSKGESRKVYFYCTDI